MTLSAPIVTVTNTTTYRCLHCRLEGRLTYHLRPTDMDDGLHYSAAHKAAQRVHETLSPGCSPDGLRIRLQA